MKNNSIGERLYARRKELSLTQREVANYVGVTEATVSRWESGEIDNMRRDKIANLARVLKVSPLLIMGLSEEDTQIKPKVIPDSREEIRLIDGYRELNDDGKSLVLNLIRQLGSRIKRPITTVSRAISDVREVLNGSALEVSAAMRVPEFPEICDTIPPTVVKSTNILDSANKISDIEGKDLKPVGVQTKAVGVEKRIVGKHDISASGFKDN